MHQKKRELQDSRLMKKQADDYLEDVSLRRFSQKMTLLIQLGNDLVNRVAVDGINNGIVAAYFLLIERAVP